MLHVIVGNNFDAIQSSVEKYTQQRERVILNDDVLDYAELDSYISGGLFNESKVVAIKNCCAEHGDVILDRAERMAQSSNIFIIIESKFLKKPKTILEKHAASFDDHTVKEKQQKDNTLFNLADLLAKKDKKNLWLQISQVLSAGKQPEEIHGILWWQIKTLFLIKTSDTNPGLHPFVYKKNTTAANNFSAEELHAIAKNLVDIYHEARMGKVDMALGLERFVLQL